MDAAITHGAGAYSASCQENADRLFAENYDLLLRIARARRRRARLSDTMSTSDILHESFLKLNGQPAWRSTDHFRRTVSLAMRQVIIDHARKKLSQKRGGAWRRAPIEAAETLFPEFSETPEQIVMISSLLERLAAKNADWLQIVDARYFAGLTEDETAEMLGLSTRTVRRRWAAARAWIADMLDARPR